MSKILDPRLHAYRSDLAGIELKGRVEAPKFVASVDYQIIRGVVNLYNEPDATTPPITQALYGEIVHVYDIKDGYAWGQLSRDKYVGYIRLDALSDRIFIANHKVRQRLTYIYPQPDLKFSPIDYLTLNAEVKILGAQDKYVQIGKDQWVVNSHLAPLTLTEPDYVKTALGFVETPYLWGGKSALGTDCSGLVQTSLHCAGITAPRDSDMQRDSMGAEIPVDSPYQRGDLIFFRGHVGMMVDETNLLHATATYMKTCVEPLSEVVDRADKVFGEGITKVKRL